MLFEGLLFTTLIGDFSEPDHALAATQFRNWQTIGVSLPLVRC